MSQLGCKCGERMVKTTCPSPCSLNIFLKEEVDIAIKEDPSVTLYNFLSGWDEKNECQHEYMNRQEPVDYWFCPACKRVYEVQYVSHGHWLRIYKRSNSATPKSFEHWKQIYVMTDESTDSATEKDIGISLFDYLQLHDSVLYYLSPDEEMVCAVVKTTADVLYSYALEEVYLPSAEK